MSLPMPHVRLLWLSGALCLVPIVVGSGCGDDADVGGSGAAAAAGGTTAGGNGGAGASTGGGVTGGAGGGVTTGGSGGIPLPTEIAMCQGHVYACGDLVDNDGDGLVDSQDPDCLGPCDNTEDSFYGGIPGQAGPPCKVDCYFDQDSGSGNDDCYWDHNCDPFEVDPNYYPEPDKGSGCGYDGPDQTVPPTGQTCSELNAAQSQQCYDYCGPLTPNGCDCFGCCELPAGSGAFVWLGSEGATGDTVCTMADLDDPALCHPCTPVTACLNGCDPCEVCIGKPLPDPGCDPGSGGGGGGGGGGTSEQCPGGEQPCGLAGQELCPSSHYCLTGCCQPFPT
jgi:hypothetical protein